jgi:DNA repair protein RadC
MPSWKGRKGVRVAELPREERPREKLLARGAASLTDVELLAVLLGTGTSGQPVLEQARTWLEQAGGLEALAGLGVLKLMERKGVGTAKAALLAAALELGKRLAERRRTEEPLLDRPELVAGLLMPLLARERIEVFGCLTLDSRNRLIRRHDLHRGARDHSPVEPSEVFHAAISDAASGVILWHTHPSGDATPSEDDVALTRRMAEAGRLLHIAVLDHVVLGRGQWVSLRQRGVLPLS